MGKGGKGKGKSWKTPFKQCMDRVKKIDPSCKVFVSGIPQDVKWKELQKHFEGSAIKPMLVETLKGGKGVAAFKNAAEAQQAMLSMNGTVMKGSTISCDSWQAKV